MCVNNSDATTRLFSLAGDALKDTPLLHPFPRFLFHSHTGKKPGR